MLAGATVAAATATPLPFSAETVLSPGSVGTEGPLEPGQMFGTRYRILRVLGAGGMGVVYQAWDQELDVAVALKVIRPEVLVDRAVADEVSRRFKRELLLARQVTHQNVVRIHDLGEIDGIKYISMPFIEGKNLAATLTEMGRLPAARAVYVIRQIAQGLQAAHEAGVVHRDLKPENVMIDAEGRPVIMDFGISRTVGGGTTIGITSAGAIVGTIEYMAPEQALGQAVDQRADIYALGLIAYDMLSGRERLATMTTPLTEMMQRLQHAPAPLRTKVPDVPVQLEAVVARALDPDPLKRYQNARELLADLDAFEGGTRPERRGTRLPLVIASAAVVLLLVLLAIAGLWLWRDRGAPAVAAHEPVSVLIADFENLTGDSVFEGSLEQSLALGIEGASFVTSYRRELARRVAAEIKPGAERLDQPTATLVAVREGVKILLAGSIAGGTSGYKITVRAVKPTDGAMLFTSSQSARDKPDVLKAVSALATRVRSELGDTAPETSGFSPETFTAASLEAMRAYSQAQALSRGHDEQAIERYQAAATLDPNFGRAYAGWAISASRLGRRDEAAEQWKKALALLGRMTSRERYRTLGGYYLDFTGDYDQAIENYKTLVELFPADEAGHGNLALAYFYRRDFASALQEGRRALEMYPADLRFRNNLALYAMYAGDFETASVEAKQVLAREKGFHTAYLPLALGALMSGDLAGARRAYDGMASTGARGATLAELGRADIALYQGAVDEAEKLLAAGIAVDQKAGNRPALARKYTALAEAYAARGNQADAATAATRAVQLSDAEAIVVPAALILLDAGNQDLALDLGKRLSGRIPPGSRAYGHLISGRVELARGRIGEAIAEYRKGIALADAWLLRLNLGVAYVRAGPEQSPAALAELEACLKRHGEVMAVFLDDVPSARYLPAAHYWLGRAREGVGLGSSALESYRTFLSLRAAAAQDTLTVDARRRVSQAR